MMKTKDIIKQNKIFVTKTQKIDCENKFVDEQIIGKKINCQKKITVNIDNDIGISNESLNFLNISGLYLIKIGVVKNLRYSMNIEPSINDDYFVIKIGKSKNIYQRLYDHSKTLGQIENSNLCLMAYSSIDIFFLSNAEKDLKCFLNATLHQINYNGAIEIFAVDSEFLQTIYKSYKFLYEKYKKKYEEKPEIIKVIPKKETKTISKKNTFQYKESIIYDNKKNILRRCNNCLKIFDKKSNYSYHINRVHKCRCNELSRILHNISDNPMDIIDILPLDLNIDSHNIMDELPEDLKLMIKNLYKKKADDVNGINKIEENKTKIDDFYKNNNLNKSNISYEIDMKTKLKCKFCNKIFSRGDSLSRHIRNGCKMEKEYLELENKTNMDEILKQINLLKQEQKLMKIDMIKSNIII